MADINFVGQGTSYGAPCALENVLAKVVIDRVPSIEMVRFVNSGTEACLSVLRLMRAFTGRDKVHACYLSIIMFRKYAVMVSPV